MTHPVRSILAFVTQVAIIFVVTTPVFAQGSIDLIFEVNGQEYENQDINLNLAVGQNSIPVGVSYSVNNAYFVRVDATSDNGTTARNCTRLSGGIDCNLNGNPDIFQLGEGSHSFAVYLRVGRWDIKSLAYVYDFVEMKEFEVVVAPSPLGNPTMQFIANAGLVGQAPKVYWGASPTAGVSYRVYRCSGSTTTDCSHNGSVIATTTSTNYADSYVKMAEKSDAVAYYSYWVTATKNGLESDPTSTVGTWGKPIYWKAKTSANGFGKEHSDTQVPEEYALFQNYPNPFNPATEIRFDLPEATHVTLTVYDMMGREVDRLIDRGLNTGAHRVMWNGSALPSGMYVYHLQAGGIYSETRKMTLLK